MTLPFWTGKEEKVWTPKIPVLKLEFWALKHTDMALSTLQVETYFKVEIAV